MNSAIKISVIVPVYNIENYLPQCLDSLVNQTLQDIEIICIDDGSTDKSLEILNEYADKYEKIKVFKQNNIGAGRTRNNGLDLAKGDYLYFMDGDDYIDFSALEKLYNRITQTGAEICVFKNRKFHQKTNKLKSCNWEHDTLSIQDKETFNKYDIPEVFFQFCNTPVWTKLYKTSFIRSNKIEFQNLKTCNDVYFNHISLALADSITFLNEELVTWRVGHSCTTATRGKYIYCILIACKSIKNRLSKEDFNLLSDTFYKRARGCFNYELKKVKNLEKRDYWTLELYSFLPKKYWSKKALKLKKRKFEKQEKIIQNIFSIKNVGSHKVFCFAGIKIKIKNQKLVERKRYKALKQQIDNLSEDIKEISAQADEVCGMA